MPRFPSLSASAQAMPESLFATLKRRMARFGGRAIPFHLGDTYIDPPEAARLGNLGFTSGPDPELYRYAPPSGGDQLIDAVLAKLQRQNQMSWAGCDNVQITCGATHALFCAMRAVMNHGDQILLCAPYWPLIRGIALSAGIRPVEVPFSHVLFREEGADIARLLEAYITPETAGVYMSNPNNPDGKVYSAAELEAVAAVVRRHNLWVISDEVYEEFRFDGREHVSLANLPGMRERTLTVFSFSKSYGQAGLRVGYLVGPTEATVAVRKMSSHSVYSVPQALQRAALRALEHGAGFVGEARLAYQRARDAAFERVVAPSARPEGGTYLFLDLSGWCARGEDSCLGVLERFAEAGLLLAPGVSFGHLYQKWARLCYTTVPLPVLEEGIERLNRVLEDA